MRKIIVSMHTSLDGFVAGPDGEMEWIHVDDELFDLVGKLTGDADTALYGRVTYQMMNSYWPTAGEKPDASKHDIEHSRWYNQSLKIVLSRTMTDSTPNKTRIIGDDLAGNIKKLKQGIGKNIVVFGSASATHALFGEGLIDELWLFVNPVVLGQGIPLFKGIVHTTNLTLLECRQYSSGVVGLHYSIP